MKLQTLKEAKYKGGKGSFHWILDTFCKPPETESGMRYYDVDLDKYIVLYEQRYVVRQFEIERDGHIFVFPIVGEGVHASDPDDIAWRITVLRKDILHPG